MNKHFFAILIAAGFLLIGCQDEQQTSETNTSKDEIAQHWVLTEAERNGKKTETLRDAYFDLQADGSGVINLDGNAQNAQWEIDDNLLKISGTQSDFLSTDYAVSNLQDSTMTLSVELRKTDFVMHFKIAEEEEDEER
jgi:heat shock protein HslJ